MELITKEIENKMKKYPYGSQDGKSPDEIEVIVKYFNPTGAGTWIATEVSAKTNDDIIFYGLAELGHGYEWGTFSLNELKSLKLPYGMKIERDLYCGNKLSDLLSREELKDVGLELPIGFIYKNKHYTYNFQDEVFYRNDVDDECFMEIPKDALIDKDNGQTFTINNLGSLCWAYGFKDNISNDKFSIMAHNTDNKWVEWINLNLKTNDFQIVGNTDQLNLWFCETRKDLTPDQLVGFTSNLNDIMSQYNQEVKMSSLIDPEDWQEIAKVPDAHKDLRYNPSINEMEL